MKHDEMYSRAEEKIERARLSVAKELDLSFPELRRPGLRRLPTRRTSRGNLTNQQQTRLARYGLTVLPESLRKLTQLQSLDISQNRITILPEWLGELTQLRSLNLSQNALEIVPDWLGGLTKLRALDLSHNPQTALPEWLGELTHLQSLILSGNELTIVPEWLRELKQLQSLDISQNRITILPECLGELTQLRSLILSGNELTIVPEWLGGLTKLRALDLSHNRLTTIPESLSQLRQLEWLLLNHNQLKDLPTSLTQLLGKLSIEQYASYPELTTAFEVDSSASIGQLRFWGMLAIDDNPFNPEITAALNEGNDALARYLRAKASARIKLNEAKLILVGEGAVGKTCLVDALLGNPWKEHDTTHGIEIKQIKVSAQDSNIEITLNSWDFGGQRVYRPTHQLFFSAPAVYLVVWKPREGAQQGFVKEWIKLIKHREPEAKILVVATHGGPKQRQPDIDRQELWDLFGRTTVIDFLHVDSKPDEQGERRGIEELKRAVARVAATLPEMGRSVPKRWQEARQALAKTQAAYLPLKNVLDLCRAHQMDDDEARLFVTIEHRLGYIIHYQHDPTLRDIVVLKPDWLATAISFVLDDEVTRKAHGLVHLSRLSQLWNDLSRTAEFRYGKSLHPVFLRLMERFDLSYRVADPYPKSDTDPLSLIGQLVPDIRPENVGEVWSSTPSMGDIHQTQICRIVDAQNGQSASAEGLFYQLIVRLHKYSLGRVNYIESVHWQRGLILDDDYNGRAMLEHVGNDVRITVQAPYPERFLAMLTSEVKYLVESFWEGLRCDVMIPCVDPCGKNMPGTGLYEVEKLIESKRRGRPEYPCPVCNDWQNIDTLLRNAPAAQPDVAALIFTEFAEVKAEVAKARRQILYVGEASMKRFDRLDNRTRRTLSRVDKTYTDLLQIFTDEAKEGPRLFSLVPVDRSNFDPRKWIRAKFRLTLWCEHSRLPLPALYGKDSRKGVYEFEVKREWFKKMAPYLKIVTGTLSLVLPVASSSIKLALDEPSYKAIEEQLNFGKSVIDAAIGEVEKIGEFIGAADKTTLEHGEIIRGHGSALRELHAMLKTKDPGFGGLIRVLNKRQEFLWVHPQFEKEY